MKRPLFTALLFLAACSGAVPSHVRQYREGPTGAGPGEAVSLALVRYHEPDADPADYAEGVADRASSLESCVAESLEDDGLRVLPADSLPPVLRQPLPDTAGPFPIAEILRRIKAEKAGTARNDSRFLVFLDAETQRSSPMKILQLVGSENDFFGETRIRASTIQAHVFDPAAPRYLGRVESASWGYQGYTASCCLPMCVIPHWARTEHRACTDLSADLLEFLRWKGPHSDETGK